MHRPYKTTTKATTKATDKTTDKAACRALIFAGIISTSAILSLLT